MHRRQSNIYPTYTFPTAEEVLNHIGKASAFAKVDLRLAYWQTALDEEAKKLRLIVNHLRLGMRNASAIFQRDIKQIQKSLQGVIVYYHDVMGCAKSHMQLEKRLDQLLKRLKQ